MELGQPQTVEFAGPREAVAGRIRRTVALLRRRGYALPAARLGGMCIGGALPESEVRRAVAWEAGLAESAGVVVEADDQRAESIAGRAAQHGAVSPFYMKETLRFVRVLTACAPFIRSVAVAGSLASGGFVATDDVDLNLIVDDGHRHLAYVAVNVLGMLHALRFRGKPVDALTRRPIAPRLMTANLILERSQCHPLARTDEDMAFELLASRPVFGHDVFREVVHANPALLEHFPQLARVSAPPAAPRPLRLPGWLFPAALDPLARVAGEWAWRYMQWTRRHSPEALERVAFVRRTMRPYTLFDRAD